MKRIILISFVVSIFFGMPILQGASTIPAKFWPVLKTAQKPGVYEDETYAGIYNKNTGILFDRKTGNLAGIWDVKGWTAASNFTKQGAAICSLWQVDIMLADAEKPLSAESKNFAPADIKATADDTIATVKINYTQVKIGAYEILLEAQASLAAEDTNVRWKISVPNKKENRFSIWSVIYPIIAVPAFDGGSNNLIVVPVRRGALRPYGPDTLRGGVPLPYPGPSAKFQFMAAYGNFSRKGLYYSTEDGEAYSKVFSYLNEPKLNSMVLKVEHLPADRGIAGTGFASPYEVVTGPFAGDWWNAARIYRQWWVKQTWASQGLLQDRKDVPDWVKKAPVCVRFSTSKPGRTIENNLLGGITLSEIIGEKPYFGIWYAPFGDRPGMQTAGLMAVGHGHVLPICDAVKKALKTMGDRHVYFMAYLQSIIYDAHFKNITPEEIKAANENVARDRKGNIIYYGVEKPETGCYAMCRATEWWQKRFVEMSVVAVKSGFRGIYFDSFGKGESECFAPNHGHAVGGGNKVIASQRQMAKRVLNAIRQIDSEAVISGEDPIEAFRDLITVNLYAVNTYANHIPIYRTVWGDYSLGHGRNSRGQAKDSIPELGRMFVDGIVLGRFFCESGDSASFWQDPKNGAVKMYVQKASNYTVAGIDYMRFGEYLHPLELKVPIIEYMESAENNKVAAPAVLNSVTRSHRDGSIGVAFTNITGKPVKFEYEIAAALRGEQSRKTPAVLYQMNEKGELKKIAEGEEIFKQSIRMEPYDIAFFVVK